MKILNWIKLKVRGFNWMKVKLKVWNEFWSNLKVVFCIFATKKCPMFFPPTIKVGKLEPKFCWKKKNQIIQVTNGDDMYICHGDLEK